MTQIALTVFPGVSVDECEAFSLILGHVPGVEVLGVGPRVGTVPGVAGVEYVEATYAEVPRPDIVVVPGGLGCRRTARDGELGGWLRQVAPTCRWVVASSTGTVVVAAAGLLNDQPAATHWLARPLLEAHGAAASNERIVESGRIITCEGRVTAVDVALLLTVRLVGREGARRVRDDMGLPDARRVRGELRRRHDRANRVRTTRSGAPWWAGIFTRHAQPGPRRPRNPELQVSDWVELELVEMDVIDDERLTSR